MSTDVTIRKPDNFHFQVTAIGTTATEIDALKKLVSDLKIDSGRAYIIFENLSAPQTRNLADKLTDFTKIPVVEITHHIDIQPNHIYVIPEDNFLIEEDRVLKLKPKDRSCKIHNGFDMFFEAFGQTFQRYATAVILAYSPLDSAAGLKKFKEAGGSTIAVLSKGGFIEDEITSEFIDYFTAPNEIADKLLQIHEKHLVTHSYDEKEESSPSEQELFDQIIEIIFLKTCTYFQHYKHTTLRRRIAKRMVDTKQESVEEYLKLLRDNPKEQDFLFDDFLISVTYFFRDQESYNNLSTTTIPFLVENCTNNIIKVWSAGCCTGEEAYSLAICIHEYLEEINRTDIKVQIIGTDLSEKCIAKARLGIYTVQDIKNISEKRLKKYFTIKDNRFHVNKVIRKMCAFDIHDLTKQEPFAKMDFVSCRNVLIYFDTELQNQVLAKFHAALRENGYLFLGRSEWTHYVPHLFKATDKLDKIYTRKAIMPYYSQKIRHIDHYSNLD